MNLTRTNKTKFIARGMVLILLLTSALVLPSCNLTSEENEVDLLKKFNLDDGSIYFLTVRSLDLDGRGREIWGSSFVSSGDTSENEDEYSRPFIGYSTTIENSDLGDGRTFYEKYIKRYLSFSGSQKYSMQISMISYAFQGKVGDIKYEFDSSFTKGEKIRIYNGDECIATMSVTTKLDMPNEFYTRILDESLFIISADKYSNVEFGDTAPKQNEIFIEPDLDAMKLSYLSIRNANGSEMSTETKSYKSYFTGGYSSVDWQTGYESAVNKLQVDYLDLSTNSSFEIRAEFYEYREEMGEIDYVFTEGEDNVNCVELYSFSVLVGKVFYSSDSGIGEDWMIDFLNENLVVISVQK